MTFCDAYPSHFSVMGSASGTHRHITVHGPMDGATDGPTHTCPLSWAFRVLYVGGNSNNTNTSNALNYGLSYANANNTLSNSNTNIGGRLTIVLDGSICEPVRITSIPVIRAPSVSPGEIQENEQSGLVALLANVRIENKGYDSMPKRIGELKYRITSMENLEEAAKRACRARRDKIEVARFEQNREKNLEWLQKTLISGELHTSQYKFFTRLEHGKERKIADLPLFPDRIARQAFAQVLEPLLDPKMIDQSHASRVNHGTHSALEQAWGYVQHERIVYCFSGDIRKCYESTDIDILKKTRRHYIKDGWVLMYLDRFNDEYPMDGMSIGDRLSPLNCNLMLTPVDHHMKENLHCHAFIRYADNFFVFGNSKEWLNKIRIELSDQLEAIGYELKPTWQIADLRTEGVDFLGYRIYKTHVLVRKKTKYRIKREMARIMRKLESGQSPDKHDRGVVASYHGVLKWCDSYNFYCKVVRPVVWAIEKHDRQIVGCRSLRRFMLFNSEVYA